jgi:coproporphyrinogen III oxidase
MTQPLRKPAEMTLDEKQSTAAAWFRQLRDTICGRFESIEKEMGSDATFVRTPWQRPDGGSGEISMMKGKIFEKVGVNISTVHGEFSEAFRKEIPSAAEDPRFWASGISLVAHMASPLVPAAHFNTRMIVVGAEGSPSTRSAAAARAGAISERGGSGSGGGPAPGAAQPQYKLWFGGGGDLNPMFEDHTDTADFHGAFQTACDAANKDFFPAFKAWCDEYFYIPHRNEARGVGGIFYDYLGLNSLGDTPMVFSPNQFGKGGLNKEATARGMEIAAAAPLDWNGAFQFTQDVGNAFATIYPELIRRHMREPWTEAQREHQLVKRGRYAEYNLLYDRGTRFGLMTGGNTEAILMSLPPVAKWE